jgi:hypothetical protein
MTSRYLTTNKMAWVRKPLNRRVLALLAIALFVISGATAFADISGWLYLGVFALALLCFWLVVIGVRAIPDANARELDERQLQIRNSNYFIAWQINTGVLFALLVILALRPEWLALPNAFSPENFWLAVAFMAAASPTFVMALRSREV